MQVRVTPLPRDNFRSIVAALITALTIGGWINALGKTPLRDALAQSLNQRAMDVWKDEPQVHELLKRTPLKELMEPVPQPLLKPTAALAEVGHAFVEHGNEFFYVSSDGQTLDGVVTITDLLRARAAGAAAQTPTNQFMTANPVALAADDDCAVAGDWAVFYFVEAQDAHLGRVEDGCAHQRAKHAAIGEGECAAGVEDAALFRSTNGGQTWAELPGLRGNGTGAQ